MNIVYNPSEQNSAQFKASNLNIVREIYDARVTLEDIIMTSIMNSLPGEGTNQHASRWQKRSTMMRKRTKMSTTSFNSPQTFSNWSMTPKQPIPGSQHKQKLQLSKHQHKTSATVVVGQITKSKTALPHDTSMGMHYQTKLQGQNHLRKPRATKRINTRQRSQSHATKNERKCCKTHERLCNDWRQCKA